MICPNETCRRKIQVSDSREKEDGSVVKRRRRCNSCCQSWTTRETIQPDVNSITSICTKKNLQPAEIYAEILKLLALLAKSMGLVKNL